MPIQRRTEGPTCGEAAMAAICFVVMATMCKSCNNDLYLQPPDNSGCYNYYCEQTGDCPAYWQDGQIVDGFRCDGKTGTIYQYSNPY